MSKRQHKTLLSVDWDYFFPRLFEAKSDYVQAHPERGNIWLYDWSAKETPFFMTLAWTLRAADFSRAGISLPGLTGQERDFWGRFQVAFGARLYVAESHSAIVHLLHEDYTQVYSYDAHHDGRKLVGSEVQCDTWVDAFLQAGKKVYVRYPDWVDPDCQGAPGVRDSQLHAQTASATNGPALVHDIFVCRSGAWTPPWCDHEFTEFVYGCAPEVTEIEGIADHDALTDAMTPRPLPSSQELDDLKAVYLKAQGLVHADD